MKKIILIILLFTSFLSASINEYLSDVYFANGIDTKEKSAYKALSEIQDNFELNYPNIYQSVSDWKVSYNHTHGIGIDLYIEHRVEDRHHKIILHIVSKISEKKKKTKFLL